MCGCVSVITSARHWSSSGNISADAPLSKHIGTIPGSARGSPAMQARSTARAIPTRQSITSASCCTGFCSSCSGSNTRLSVGSSGGGGNRGAVARPPFDPTGPAPRVRPMTKAIRMHSTVTLGASQEARSTSNTARVPSLARTANPVAAKAMTVSPPSAIAAASQRKASATSTHATASASRRLVAGRSVTAVFKAQQWTCLAFSSAAPAGRSRAAPATSASPPLSSSSASHCGGMRRWTGAAPRVRAPSGRRRGVWRCSGGNWPRIGALRPPGTPPRLGASARSFAAAISSAA